MDATTLIIEQRFATFILLNVYRNPGILKKMAVDEDGGSMRVKYQTLNKLIAYGLIREDEQKYKHNAKPLFCTDMGNIVGENLERIHQALPYKECSSEEYKRPVIAFSKPGCRDP